MASFQTTELAALLLRGLLNFGHYEQLTLGHYYS